MPPPDALPSNACPMCGAAQHGLLTSKTFRGKEFSLACCNACGQHYCLPIPSEAEIAAFYAGDYHGELRTPGQTEQAFGEKFRRYRDWIRQFLPGGRTLDVGTSTGLLPSLLKQAGFDAEGLEYNTASAAWGEANYGVRIRNSSLSEIDEPPGCFDLISMTDVLEHTGNPLHFLRMASAYLKPRGLMLITFPDIASLESRYLRLASRILSRDWIWSSCHIPLHVWEFTPGTARAMFDKAGFDVEAFRRSHQSEPDLPGNAVVTLLNLPLKLLANPFVGRLFGTQMEFMIRKRAD